MMTLDDRWRHVRERIAAACTRAGRDVADVQVIAVSKMFGPDRVAEAVEAGIRLFGESRIQEARQKIPLCPSGLEWHLIGHLQRNKVAAAVGLFDRIHSVDSGRLLESVNAASEAAGRVMPVLLEVNVSGEAVKFGLRRDEVPALLEACGAWANVDVRGLMTIPPFSPDPERSRPHFARLREWRDAWREQTGFDLSELSMGMSGDFEVAVEEGATQVRIGSLLFGDRSPSEDVHGQSGE